MSESSLKEQVKQMYQMILDAKHTTVLTGAGISVSSHVPDMEMMTNVFGVFESTTLENHPDTFWSEFHKDFVDPIFKYGPNKSHRVLAKLEQADHLDSIVTTNVDYLHNIAGNTNVMPIWSDLNTNHCINCGRIFDINHLKDAIPRCPNCNGVLSPDPVFRHIATLPDEVRRANQIMRNSDLTIVIGSNGYYSQTSNQHVININPKTNTFDQRSDLILRHSSDDVFNELEQIL